MLTFEPSRSVHDQKGNAVDQDEIALQVRGGSFRVYRRGSSTPIVLLHGGGLDSARAELGIAPDLGPGVVGDHQPRAGVLEARRRRSKRAAPEARALVVSLDSYDLATVERGWRPDEVEQSRHASLSELLLR
jgi:hypothetical protein